MRSPLALALVLLLTQAGASAAKAASGNSRLPRTSAASASLRASSNNNNNATASPGARNQTARPAGGSLRAREQYLFNVFEVVVSTLESKLQRIENLDKAVEHLMRRVELLDSRVTDNIDKTDSVIARLRALDLRLFSAADAQPQQSEGRSQRLLQQPQPQLSRAHHDTLDARLVSLDQKVSDIDTKLSGLKSQLDSNLLPADDINAEASEKKPISMSLGDVTKVLTAEVVSRVSKELDGLRTATTNVDRKLQFHINLVSENIGKVLSLVSEVHGAVLEPAPASPASLYSNSSAAAGSLDRLIRPLIGVAHKVDEVWDVVAATKGSVDGLVAKADDLLHSTQRQERAVADTHQDLRAKANKIIANLDQMEQRLRQGEVLNPVAAELLLDPTIDRLVEYDPVRYRNEPPPPAATEPLLPPPPSSTPPMPAQQQQPAPSAPVTAPGVTVAPAPTTITTSGPLPSTSNASGRTPSPPASRNRGVIFPSVKNKPSPANTTFTTDLLAGIKDVKGYSCVDLLNAGMRDSGVYYLQIRGTTYWFLKVYCEQEVADGGWTVIQRRDDFGEPRESFNRDWTDYKNGFGDPAKELWLGNENIYMLTNNEDYMLRVELEDFEGNKRYAQYSHFKIYSEAEYYKLEIDGYEGNAGDSLNDPWYGSNNSPFSTYNRDNDRSSLNCASMLKGGWWWKSCGRGLNGLYLNDPQDLTARQGIVWFRWRGWDYTLKKAVMMIKPRGSVASSPSTSSSSA